MPTLLLAKALQHVQPRAGGVELGLEVGLRGKRTSLYQTSPRRDLERVHDAWDDCKADRRRDAIYGYLEAVCGLVSWWTAEGCEVDRARRALRLRGLLPWPRDDVFAAIIRCTADPARADKRTRSKWSRVLRYVAMHKEDAEPLARFVKRKGGINECNARYRRCLRRLAASRRSIAEFQRRSASRRTAVV
jgi:hypothetical protein